ncbi:MAG TPA: hypothetical protein GYA08_07060 [Chloroflexi bacterium]|nr:hypothetical protein [Chloroflexota bacterium]
MQQTQDACVHNIPSDSPPPPPRTDAAEEYEPPAIVYRAPLEVTAAFCDPLAGGKTPVDNCFMVINS